MIKMYIVTYSMDIVALLFLLGILCGSNMMELYRRKPFLLGIALTIIVILSEAGTILVESGDPKLRGINILCNILGFALAPVLPFCFIAASDVRSLREHKWLLLPTLINITAVALSPVFKWIFFVDSGNQYSRGNYFIVFVLVYIFNLLLLVMSMMRLGKKYCYPIQGKMTALSIFAVVGTSIQLVDSSVHSSWHCITIVILLYLIVLSEFDSSFDALTGLYNRAAFEKTARQKRNKAFSVIVLDINDFKRINDSFGHDYGDIIIKTVAGIIRESLDNHYTCYRAGGDEFYIIGNETDADKIQSQLKKVTTSLAERQGINGHLSTVAYGFSIVKGGEETPDLQKMIQDADRQMYHYKKLKKSESMKAQSLKENA